MAETTVEAKKLGVIDRIKEGLKSLSNFKVGFFTPIIEKTELAMKNINEGMIQIERRIQKKITSFLILWLGGILLIFALLSYLREFLGWSNTLSYFSVGITILVICLMLKKIPSQKSST